MPKNNKKKEQYVNIESHVDFDILSILPDGKNIITQFIVPESEQKDIEDMILAKDKKFFNVKDRSDINSSIRVYQDFSNVFKVIISKISDDNRKEVK